MLPPPENLSSARELDYEAGECVEVEGARIFEFVLEQHSEGGG
jgi:hypothetical protein